MFKKLFAGKKPDDGAVVFDAPGRTFRDERFAGYKAQRQRMPSLLAQQLAPIDRLVAAHGFPLLRVSGYEADDVIGTLTKQAQAAGLQVLIISGDKDFCQLLDGDVRMLDAMRDITYDAELVRKKWGVPPNHFVDLLALMGDSIDNIPGVPGIGQKSAAALLEKYGSLDAVLADAAHIKGKQGALLLQYKDQALLSQELARIDTQVPLDVTLDGLVLPPANEEALKTLYTELEFLSLLSERQAATAATDIAVDPSQLVLSDGCTLVPFDDGAPRPRWKGLGVSNGGDAITVSFTDPPAALREYLESDKPKRVHNAKLLWLLCLRDGLTPRNIIFDTMIAGFLVEPSRTAPQRLDQLAREYLQQTLSPAMGEHAKAAAALEPVLREKLGDMSELLRSLELPLAEVLARMQHTGIAVDAADIATMGKDFRARLVEVEAEIFKLAGREFNVGSPKQLGAVLFDELKLPIVKRTKTGYSTDAEVLERLAPKHPIAAHLLEQRKLSKLISTYTNVLSAAIDPETQRIHANTQQTASQTGRLIATDPDLQRTPIRTPEGKRIRRAFIARFFDIYAGVTRWRQGIIDQAHKLGYVKTMLGRKRVIPELFSHNSTDSQTGERIAVNTPVQGSAADLCKKAMLDISSAASSARLLLQIHDELLFEVPEAEVDAAVGLINEKMTQVVTLSVPLVVSVGVGFTWADAH